MSGIFPNFTSLFGAGRVFGSFKGIVFGMILIPLSVLAIVWNENRAINTATSLKEGRELVVSVEPGTVNPANAGKLIHVSGGVTTTQTVRDPLFSVSAPVIRLTRKAEIYQWKEEKQSSGRNRQAEETDTANNYTYKKVWSDKAIDSSVFKLAADHKNRGGMLAPPAVFTAPLVTLGGFRVNPDLIAQMRGDETLQPGESDLKNLADNLKAGAKLDGHGFYIGNDPAAPEIGDQRVTFEVLKPAVFSIIARQNGNTFEPFPTSSGRELERVEAGTVSADLMFLHAAKENMFITWGLRAGCMLLMAFGISRILGPLTALLDMLPFVGGILGFGMAIASLLLAAAVSTVTIALAWLLVRPLLTGMLIAAALALLFACHHLGKRTAPGPAPVLP